MSAMSPPSWWCLSMQVLWVSTKSNKFMFHNILSHCCLVGKVNQTQRNDILEEIGKSKANYFLILCQAAMPNSLVHMVECIYKYNSDCKPFTQIPTKAKAISMAAFTIQGHLRQNKKPTTPKKGSSTPK